MDTQWCWHGGGDGGSTYVTHAKVVWGREEACHSPALVWMGTRLFEKAIVDGKNSPDVNAHFPFYPALVAFKLLTFLSTQVIGRTALLESPARVTSSTVTTLHRSCTYGSPGHLIPVYHTSPSALFNEKRWRCLEIARRKSGRRETAKSILLHAVI